MMILRRLCESRRSRDGRGFSQSSAPPAPSAYLTQRHPSIPPAPSPQTVLSLLVASLRAARPPTSFFPSLLALLAVLRIASRPRRSCASRLTRFALQLCFTRLLTCLGAGPDILPPRPSLPRRSCISLLSTIHPTLVLNRLSAISLSPSVSRRRDFAFAIALRPPSPASPHHALARFASPTPVASTSPLGGFHAALADNYTPTGTHHTIGALRS